MKKSKFDAIVVGAGISGLLSALALSKEGKSVLVVEKSSEVGGNCRTYEIDGYHMDTGPHAITGLGKEGPLQILMDKYFDKDIKFVPIGVYYARDDKKLQEIPVTIKDLIEFNILSRKDRVVFLTAMIDAVASSSMPFRKEKLKMSVYDYIKKYKFSKKGINFIDSICYFLSGRSMKETPAWRMLGGSGFLDEAENSDLKSRKHIEKIKKLTKTSDFNEHVYPLGGVQSITNAILSSMPKNKTEIKVNEKVIEIKKSSKEVFEVKTEKGSYESDIVIYSGFAKDLPMIIKNLKSPYKKNIKKLKQAKSICLWLGLKKEIPSLSYVGSEVYFDTDTPYWAIPVSNYDRNLAPKGKQLIGFSAIFKEKDVKKQIKKLKKTIFKAIPDIESEIEFEHIQVTIPEKAAVTTNVEFPSPKSPIEGLYLVGTDIDIRSMGLTRASYSVIEALRFMREDGVLK